MTPPSDTTTPPWTINARVHDNAIACVPKFFPDSLTGIFTELLQNARRAGATRVDINTDTTCVTPPNPAENCITVTDNGVGIADPAILLSFGDSGWDNTTVKREDPAGMGITALSRRGCIVSSTTLKTSPWHVTLSPANFLGEIPANVINTFTTDIQPYPHGTAVTFATPENLPSITAAITDIARYYPLSGALGIALPYPPAELPRWNPTTAQNIEWHHTTTFSRPVLNPCS